MENINIEVEVSEEEVKKYGKKGLNELLADIIERYFCEDYFDPDIVRQILNKKI